MSKIDTVKSLLRLAAARPRQALRAIPYVLKHGLLGARDRMHQEIVLGSVVGASDEGEPGSERGSILFSVLMPTHDVDVRWVSQAIESVRAQTYGDWELCVVDDASSSRELREYLLGQADERVRVRLLDENLGISGATNVAASMATGDYLLPLDNDDVLSSDALFQLFLRVSMTHADVVYSDHEVVDEQGSRLSVLFKPDWSPDLLLSQMYVGHALAFRKSLFERVGGFRSEFDGAQDYDLMLRMSRVANKVEHVSRVLYSWRALETSTATNAGSKPYAQTAGLRAVQNHLDVLLGSGAATACETDDLFVYDVRYHVEGSPKASVIIPTKDNVDDLRTCVASILERTAYENYEIVVVDNGSREEETARGLEELRARDPRVRVMEADIPFNWSRINNLAAREATGDVLVFLNNDTEVIAGDWLGRLVEQATRDEVGVVGGLLLYPDGTIQHAGVVVGMGGWADHVYKGCQPVHYGDPFVSPMVTRDVTAVTGACMAVSRATFEELGGFDEQFVVCGSDVEICLRALQRGLRNVYSPYVRLTHYESKTRDPRDIPQGDFDLSARAYQRYRTAGDPMYNVNLDTMQCVPTVLTVREKLRRASAHDVAVAIPEVRPVRLEPDPVPRTRPRLNLMVPSVLPENVYGGVSTALKFFDQLADLIGADRRIVVGDEVTSAEELGPDFADYEVLPLGAESAASRQVVSAVRNVSGTLSVTGRDWFVCTLWTTAYCMQSEWLRLRDGGFEPNPLVYLIQDFEPGFYPWSSEYLLAESTYRSEAPTIGVFNSRELHDYFVRNGYSFEREYVFDPFLNERLAARLEELGGRVGKRRQILVYGRPGVHRNAFRLLVEALRKWIELYPDSRRWEIVSAGEEHPAVYLDEGRVLVSAGKLSLDGYADVLSESYAGVSLMASPHPSYPPLEMAAFGVRVITNGFAGKDLSSFGESVVSVPTPTVDALARTLVEVCEGYEAEVACGRVREGYLTCEEPFDFLPELAELIRERTARD